MQIDLIGDVRDADYRALLAAVRPYADAVQFVVRAELPITQGGLQIIDEVRPWVTEVHESSEWPGTVLYGHTARVTRFRYAPSVEAILVGRANGLYDWQQPDRPEDLCLLRADQTPLLVTIAHECDGFLAVAANEWEILCNAVPVLMKVGRVIV